MPRLIIVKVIASAYKIIDENINRNYSVKSSGIQESRENDR